MKQNNFIALFPSLIGVSIIGFSQSAQAATFVGTPSPNLRPTFGTLINFDDRATGTVINANDYVAQGLASITETTGAGAAFQRRSGSQSSPNYIGTGSGYEIGGANQGWDGTIRFEFANLARKVGIGIANNRGGPEFLRIYDASNNLLEPAFQAPNGINVYAGFQRTTYDIKSFEVSGDFFAVDDLQFKQIPEPLTILCSLTALGFGALFKRELSKKQNPKQDS